MTSGLTNHWTDNKAWTSLQVHQKYAAGEKAGQFYTEGPIGAMTTSKFTAMKHEETGDLLNKNSNSKTLLKVALISAVSIPSLLPILPSWCAPYLALTILGNTGLPQLVADGYNRYAHGTAIELPKGERVWQNLSSAALKVGILLVPTLIYNNLGFEIYGCNFFTTLAILSWAGYVIYNPRGAALAINTVEEKVNVKSLDECNSLASKQWLSTSNWRSLLTGAIPLTSVLDIHRVGNIKDKVDNEPRFPQVDEAKKDK